MIGRPARVGPVLPALLPALLLAGVAWQAQAWAQAQSEALDGAGIRLSSTETEIFLGDSVVIDVQSVGLLEPLDTAPLFSDADLLRETAGTRIAVVDGKVVDVRTRHMEFLPRREGLARFGPLSGESGRGTVRSGLIEVRVKPLVETVWEPDANDYRLSLTVSRADPHIHALVTIDLELRHRHPIADERIALPGFDGLDTLDVYAARRPPLESLDPIDRDARPWRRVQWRWLAWPNRSGTIEIAPAHWQGTLIRSRTARADFRSRSETVRLQVAPASTDGADWWLPARNVRLSDAWSKDPTTLSAGDEIVRTLTLMADDVPASQLPAIVPLASRSLSSEPLGVTRDQALVDGRISATAEYRFRLTARSPVPVFLDTVRVPWWDTVTGQAREAIVPARRVNIGLPDRADLLADAALEGGVPERWSLRLRSIAARLPASDALGAGLALVLAAGLLGTVFGPGIGRVRRRPSGSVDGDPGRRRARSNRADPGRPSSLPPA